MRHSSIANSSGRLGDIHRDPPPLVAADRRPGPISVYLAPLV
jgi:hypothetical protein